jgi:hypothetical protein
LNAVCTSRILKKSISVKTIDNSPIISCAIPVIAVMILLILVFNHLRRSMIPATKSSRPIVSSSNRGRLQKFWMLSLSKMRGSRILMIKKPIIMIPTNMRKPPRATANLLSGFAGRSVLSSLPIFYYPTSSHSHTFSWLNRF